MSMRALTQLFCADGTDNPAALAYYEGGWVKGFTPKVLVLPATASYGQVVGAVCADIFGHGSPMGLQAEQQAYDLAANRAGWRYHINTVNGLSCPGAGTSLGSGRARYGHGLAAPLPSRLPYPSPVHARDPPPVIYPATAD